MRIVGQIAMSFQSSTLKTELVPLKFIRRPIPPVLDLQKIDAMTATLDGNPTALATCTVENITAGELPPVDVFKVRDKGREYFFAVGGCHRLQAYDQRGSDTLVRCRILPATRLTLKVYLGASVDSMFED